MVVEKLNLRISCDMIGCKNMADYVIRQENVGARGNFYVCNKCLSELSDAILKAEIKGDRGEIRKKK